MRAWGNIVESLHIQIWLYISTFVWSNFSILEFWSKIRGIKFVCLCSFDTATLLEQLDVQYWIWYTGWSFLSPIEWKKKLPLADSVILVIELIIQRWTLLSQEMTHIFIIKNSLTNLITLRPILRFVASGRCIHLKWISRITALSRDFLKCGTKCMGTPWLL